MKIIGRILLVLLIIIIVALGFLIIKGKEMYSAAIDNTSIDDKVDEIRTDAYFTKIDEVPDYYVNAVISIEDRRFRDHGAIDIISIARAIVTNIQSKDLSEGGSTITQQVAKNMYFMEESNFVFRKIAEAFVAHDLESKYSKDEIFELYMNTIYFGDGYYGIYEASKGYFNKLPKELNLDEATMLAGIPNAPSVYAPTVNPDLAKSRQGKVLRDMVEYGYLSQEEADKILNK